MLTASNVGSIIWKCEGVFNTHIIKHLFNYHVAKGTYCFIFMVSSLIVSNTSVSLRVQNSAICPHLFSSVTPQLITHWSQLCSSSPPRHYISIIQEAGAFLKVVFSMKGRKQSALAQIHMRQTNTLQSSSCRGKECSVQRSIKRVFARLFLALFFLGIRKVVAGWHLNAPHEVIS